MRPAVYAHRGRRSVPLKPDDGRDIGTEQPADFDADGGEDLSGGHAPRYQRRDTAQRVQFVVGGMQLAVALGHLHLEFSLELDH
jgi:hypothetical protein